MHKDQIVLYGRTLLDGSHRTGRHDKSVNEYHEVLLSSPHHRSDGCHHLETSEVTDHINCCRMRHLFLKSSHRLSEHLRLMPYTFIIQSGARSDTVFQGQMSEDTHPDARW